MKKILFNYCLPRACKSNNETIYALVKGGEKMNVDTIMNIQKLAKDDNPKQADPWCQVFANGYRVTNDNINWAEWNGITFSDIDSKLYYNNVAKWDINKLKTAINETAMTMFYDNYVCCYITGSKKGYRILWYWECERTEDNFIKCSLMTERYTKDVFYAIGKDARNIIDYSVNGKKVLDSCSKSIKQGLYFTSDKPLFNELINKDTFGTCNGIDNISISETIELNNKRKNENNIAQSDVCKFISKKHVKGDEIKYYPHPLRRCIYEALIRLFVDKDKVDEEWKYIANLIPEENHNHKFYIDEPDKNKWYEKYSNDYIHDLGWLTPFGYKFTDDINYIYERQFNKSWKKHIKQSIFDKWTESAKFIIEMGEYVESEQERLKNKHIETFGKLNTSDLKAIITSEDKIKEEYIKAKYELVQNEEIDIMNDKFLENFNSDEKDEIIELKKQYYKNRWDASEFNYLLYGYKKPNDLETYKMYADFHYRDKNNLPIIKYDILEDETLLHGYWYETDKAQWHTFKYGHEYTEWCNNNTFDNKCSKTNLVDAVDKFVKDNHSYNSIVEYWKSLDLSKANEELLETWAIRHFKCDDTPLTRYTCKSFFIAAVKKQMIEDPTTWAFPSMLLIQGPTGCGKTFFLKKMFTFAGHELILNKINPNDPDNIIGPLIKRNMLIQFGEGASLKRADNNTQKDFMDRINATMKFQKKYENEQTTVKPRVVVCRTSNEDVLFNDVSINEGDRRNLLLVCKCPAMSCDEKMRKQIEDEKDILWATAFKLYNENPDYDLQLTKEMFNELDKIQEDFKMIKNDDITEIYNSIFEHDFYTDENGMVIDEYCFKKSLERSSEILHQHMVQINVGDNYNNIGKIKTVNARWVNDYVKEKHGINAMKLLKDYMLNHGWEYKVKKINSLAVKVYAKNNMKNTD